jgi:transposase
MWVPPEEKDPVLLHAPTRKSIALFGGIQIRSGKLITMTASPFNTDSFAVFLRYLARHRDRRRKTILIIDNAGYHHPADYPDCLQLNYLPPYSPELNPIERVWKLLRRLRIHNQYFDTLERLLSEVSEQLALWVRPNEPLRKLCCII